MKKLILIAFLFSSFFVSLQELPCRLEELTAPDFIKAVEKSSKTCIIPIGVMEKHGPHLPLGTMLF
ncbi:MAG: creatininase family protein [Draconibacterium sp.]